LRIETFSSAPTSTIRDAVDLAHRVANARRLARTAKSGLAQRCGRSTDSSPLLLLRRLGFEPHPRPRGDAGSGERVAKRLPALLAGPVRKHDNLIDQTENLRRSVVARIWAVANDQFERFIVQAGQGLQQFAGTQPSEFRVKPHGQGEQHPIGGEIERALVEDQRLRGVADGAGEPGVARRRVDQGDMDAAPRGAQRQIDRQGGAKPLAVRADDGDRENGSGALALGAVEPERAEDRVELGAVGVGGQRREAEPGEIQTIEGLPS
jgi:hypothetical protein